MRVSNLLGLALLLTGFLTLTGCDPVTKTDDTGGQTADNVDGHGQDHGDGHDHAHHDHEVGPHDGDIIKLGDNHAELVHKKKSNVVSVYLLDSTKKKPLPIDDTEEVLLNLTVQGNPAQFTLTAAPLDDDPEGKTSRFELDDAVLADLLSGEDDVTGRLNVAIDGTDQVGEIDHHAHDHAHDHGDHEGHDHAEGDHDHAEE